MGREDDVAARPRREVAHEAGFDVDRAHDVIVSRHVLALWSSRPGREHQVGHADDVVPRQVRENSFVTAFIGNPAWTRR
jgi:hypothetical protein